MTDADTAPPKQLHGAAAAAARKAGAHTSALDTFLKTISEGYKSAREEAVAAVDQAREALAEAEANLAKVESFNPDRSHHAPSPASRARSSDTSERAPRGAVSAKVLEMLQAHPDGYTRGALLDAMGIKGNKQAESSVSNSLVQLKKANKIDNRDGTYVAA